MTSAGEARARALAFVADHGDALLARAAAAAGDARLRGELRDDRETVAKADAPAEMLRLLSLLDDLGVRDGGADAQLAARLEASQAPDGCWGEDAAGLVLTGLLTGQLGRRSCVRGSVLDAATSWLAERFAPERVQGFAWENVAAFAAAFANVPHDASDGVLQWCGRELERGHRAGRFDPVRTARVLVWCDTPFLPGCRVDPTELVDAMIASQAPDGGFGEAGAPVATRAERAWDAAVALQRLAPAT